MIYISNQSYCPSKTLLNLLLQQKQNTKLDQKNFEDAKNNIRYSIAKIIDQLRKGFIFTDPDGRTTIISHQYNPRHDFVCKLSDYTSPATYCERLKNSLIKLRFGEEFYNWFLKNDKEAKRQNIFMDDVGNLYVMQTDDLSKLFIE